MKDVNIIGKLSLAYVNVHNSNTLDSNIGISIPCIICYCDKNYYWPECRGNNGAMERLVRSCPLSIYDICSNLLISRIKTILVQPYPFFYRMFYLFQVVVKTVKRVRVKIYFTAFWYNLVGCEISWWNSVRYWHLGWIGRKHREICGL